MRDDSDDALMVRAGSGEKPAFGQLVERHLARAGAIAGRIVGNRSDAEEIVQEAFLRAWLKAPSWLPQGQQGGGAQFTTWFYRVVVNLCLDRKRRAPFLPIEAAGEVPDPQPGGYDATLSLETGNRVAAAVAALPERQRAALTLCHYEGLSNIEAAAVLDLSVGALESLLVRARRSLRGSLADLAPQKGDERAVTPDRIRELLAAYGADPMRWPAADRATASAARSDPALRALVDEARTLDALIDRHASPPLPLIDAAALVARVTATPQPRGHVVRPAAAPRPRVAGWPFAFGWPNVAGLASVALIGFFVGWMNFDGTAAQADDDEPASGIFGVFEDLPW